MRALGIGVEPSFNRRRHTEGRDLFYLAALNRNWHMHVFNRVNTNRKASSFST